MVECFGEMDMASLPFNFGPELSGDGVEAGGGDFLQIAPGDFLLEALELGGEHPPAFMPLTEDDFGQGLGFGGAEIGNLELMLAAPLDEGGLGDV